jgi:hypothetical protein
MALTLDFDRTLKYLNESDDITRDKASTSRLHGCGIALARRLPTCSMWRVRRLTWMDDVGDGHRELAKCYV